MVRAGLSGLVVAVLLLASCTADTAIPEVTVAPADDWIETVSRRESAPASAQSVSPDGRWLATSGRDVCIHSLVDDVAPTCTSEETMGGDTLSWNADSTVVTPGSTWSGRFDNNGVWTITTDGVLTSIVPVEEGNVVTGDSPGLWSVGMGFRPDGGSIVYFEVRDDGENDAAYLVEADLDGERTVLATVDRRTISNRPVLPLADGRVVVTTGIFDDVAIDLFDDGEWTRLVTGSSAIEDLSVPVAVEVQPIDEELVLVQVPRANTRDASDRDEWSLVDLDGNEFPLAAPGDREVAAATFSPDGRYVGYVSVERLDARDIDFHVAEVSAILAGGEALGTHPLDGEAAFGLLRGFRDDPRVMRWTADDRVLIAVPNQGEQAPVIEIGLSGP